MFIRLVLAMSCVLAFASQYVSTDAAQATPEITAPIDLAALVLTPSDLNDLGLTGFERKGLGDRRTFAEYVAVRADFLNKDLAEMEALFTDAGWQSGYSTNLALAIEPGNPDSPESALVFTAVYAYADTAGAMLAYEGNSDFSQISEATVDTTIGPEDSAGDASFVVRTLEMSGPDGPTEEVAITMQVDRIVASVGMITFGLTETDIASPQAVDTDVIDQVQSMAELVSSRIQEMLAGGAPGLSARIVRLEGPQIVFATEGYRLVRRSLPPYYGGFEDDFPALASAYEFDSVYEVNQAIGASGDPYYASRLFTFNSADAAAAFLDSRKAEPFENGDVVADVIERAGDDRVLFAYEAQLAPDYRVEGFAAYVLVDSTVIWILIEGAERPADTVLSTLVAAEVSCLESTGPCAPIDVPADLLS